MREIEEAIQIHLDELSISFQTLIRRQLIENGNGSRIMRDVAAGHVKEISRKFYDGMIELEVGVDENISDERARIRTLVVLYGNVTNGPLMTKPGQQTWRKHVSYRGLSEAKTAHRIPHWEQTDVSGKIMQNVMNDIDKLVGRFLRDITHALDTIDFSEFITGG